MSKVLYIVDGLNPERKLEGLNMCPDMNEYDVRESIRIRIEVPDSVELEDMDWCFETYNEDIRICDCNPKVCVKFNTEIKVCDDLTEMWLKDYTTDLDEILTKNGFQNNTKFGYLNKKQQEFLNKLANEGRFAKIWLLDKIPDDAENFKFPGKEFYDDYKEDIEILKNSIDDKYKELDLSDEELLDKWGFACFMHCSAYMKPNKNSFIFKIEFLHGLDTRLGFENILKKAETKDEAADDENLEYGE